MSEVFPLAKVGQPAPGFGLKAISGHETVSASLSDYRGRWLVLFFYPYDFSIVCPTEIIALSDHFADFAALGADILGVSTDSLYAHRAWLNTPREDNGIAEVCFPLASDITKQTSRDYGILDEQEGVALRGLFIIDDEGVLQYSVTHNLNIGRSVEETLRVLEALQAGGLCASDWKPGQKTLSS
jgi:alkyl hydroperoxide reductase subunit AhpC